MNNHALDAYMVMSYGHFTCNKLSGRGYYQAWGEEAIEMKPGDVVNIPAGVKHWHGAALDSWFAHLAFSVPGEGCTNEWLEPVSDEQYGQLG